jgi:4-amino-4-deoxy-L-arabinose transferase-like glycosyltransferase
MKLLQKHTAALLVLLSILALWVHRFSSLENPYFWDEMGVYGNGVQYLLEHGISILPNAMPTEISRGHPLLFYAIHAFALKIFGNSFIVSHAFALIISSACLLSTYLLAREFLPKIVAAFTTALFASMNIFLAQSTLVLPEMMVALMSTTALFFYIKKKYLLVALVLAAGVLIKESMIISAAFLGLLYFIEQIRSNALGVNITKLLLFTFPLLVFLLFLAIQKVQNGWYFFPYHTEIIQESSFSGFFVKLEMHYNFMFYKQGRNQWIFGFALAIISLLFIGKNSKLSILISYLFYGIGLFSLAFYMDRYLLFLYPVLIILVVQGVYFLCLKRNNLSILVISFLVILSLMSLDESKFRIDASLAYEDVISIHQEAVNQFCQAPKSERTCFSNFPINMSLCNNSLGYLEHACQKKILAVSDEASAEYLILFNATNSTEGFELIHQFEKNEVIVRYYKRL